MSEENASYLICLDQAFTAQKAIEYLKHIANMCDKDGLILFRVQTKNLKTDNGVPIKNEQQNKARLYFRKP